MSFMCSSTCFTCTESSLWVNMAPIVFFPTICKHLLLYSLWNNDGSPEILAFDKGSKEITIRNRYLCDNEQKGYCKFLLLFFQGNLGNFREFFIF